MNFARFEKSLEQNAAREADRRLVRARVLDGIGNEHYWAGQPALARQKYWDAIAMNPWMISVHVKALLLSMGRPGDWIRKTILSYR
jgi:hypothetical protein